MWLVVAWTCLLVSPALGNIPDWISINIVHVKCCKMLASLQATVFPNTPQVRRVNTIIFLLLIEPEPPWSWITNIRHVSHLRCHVTVTRLSQRPYPLLRQDYTHIVCLHCFIVQHNASLGLRLTTSIVLFFWFFFTQVMLDDTSIWEISCLIGIVEPLLRAASVWSCVQCDSSCVWPASGVFFHLKCSLLAVRINVYFQ